MTAQAQMHQAAAADAARYELSSGTYYRRILKTLVKLSDTPVVQSNQPYNNMTITGCCALRVLRQTFRKQMNSSRGNPNPEPVIKHRQLVVPLQCGDHLVLDHNQNKIAKDNKVGRVDDLGHRIRHLELGADPMGLDPLTLSTLAEEIFPALQVECPLRRPHVLTVIDSCGAVDEQN